MFYRLFVYVIIQ